MSNLYKLTKEIHELLPQVKAKYGLEFEVKAEKCIYCDKQNEYQEEKTEALLEAPQWFIDGSLAKLEEKQLRQILVALKGVLGENPEFLSLEYKIENLIDESGEGRISRLFSRRLGGTKYFKAETFCQNWLDGLDPLFDREPETVLTELRDLLKSLIK